MFAPSFTAFAAVARLTTGLFEAVSLGLFALVIANVFDNRFPAKNPGLTVLPALALGFAILWNIAAIATLSRVRASVHAIGDMATAVILVVLGATGFASDDKNYLSNGKWLEFDDTNWLVTEAVAGTLIVVSFIMQLLLALLSWHQVGYEKTEMQRKMATFSYRNDEERSVTRQEAPMKQERQKAEGAANNFLITEYKNMVNSRTSSDMN